MGRTRVFYGHEGIVAPLGLYAPAGDEPEVDEAIVEEVELPGARAKVAELDAFAEEHGIVFAEGASAKDKHAAIAEWAENLPELEGAADGEEPPVLTDGSEGDNEEE